MIQNKKPWQYLLPSQVFLMQKSHKKNALQGEKNYLCSYIEVLALDFSDRALFKSKH